VRDKSGAMSLLVGLDVGTTNIGAIALEVADGARLVASLMIPNTAAYAPSGANPSGRAELDLSRLFSLVESALTGLAQQLGPRAGEVAAIGVTGQQHGLALLGTGNVPLASAITWQDRRTAEPDAVGQTSLAQFIEQAGGLAEFTNMGCSPATGYLGPSLFWLKQRGLLPPLPAQACLIPDSVTAYLTGAPPCTDPTDAGSTALYDLASGDWAWPLIQDLGLPAEIMAPVKPTGSLAGGLRFEIATACGLPPNTPVGVALGDNQASFLGSVRQPDKSLLLNVGTGAQCSALINRFQRLSELDTRAFLGDRFLLVGAGLFGGRSYTYLQNLFKQVGKAFYGSDDDSELYERMNLLAGDIPPGCDGLKCSPFFTGTRVDPSVRASFTGISPDNLTPGHLTRALLEGMAEAFHSFTHSMRPITGERSVLVGAGNGIRRNPVFADILARRWGLPMTQPAWEEAGAVGAALCAAVAFGAVEDWSGASALVSDGTAIGMGREPSAP
jgi:sugar (pentulose or hexulose) kinase